MALKPNAGGATLAGSFNNNHILIYTTDIENKCRAYGAHHFPHGQSGLRPSTHRQIIDARLLTLFKQITHLLSPVLT